MISIIGLVLLVAGGWATVATRPVRPDDPPAGWHADPVRGAPRRRFWDGQAWTRRVVEQEQAAPGGRRFHGRFRGRWLWWFAAAVVVIGVCAPLYPATGSLPVLVGLSLVGMALVCAGVYGFVERQLDLHQVVRRRTVAAVAVASSGVVLLVAIPLNDAIISAFGLTVGLGTVGLVEELTKLVAPVALALLLGVRDPRAGIAAGLASGFGFAIAETTTYAFALPLGGAPDPCTGALLPAADPVSAVVGQVYRIFLVSPLHWLWTGIAVAVVWRAVRVRGARRAVLPAGAGVLFVVGTHSLNDSSAVWWCGAPPTTGLLQQVVGLLIPVVLYLVFKAAARRSVPPQLVGAVSRGWRPRRLPTD
jgi:RsiW-degrading membrane proteinase PrsW (M82 family)